MTPVSRAGLTTLYSATLAAIFSLPALAQEDGMLEEVIVTAQKRAEDLQDTAIAITAISGSTMDDLNISNSEDYEAIVPSLSVRTSPNRLFLRGIGRVTNSLGTEPGVAVYLDQIYTSEITVLGRASSLTTRQLDVLRGPQGTLFGRNATGGAVSVTSKRPTREYEHELRATAGNYSQFNWGGASSGPITDKLGYRVHAYGNSHDGYVKNRGGKDIFDEDHKGWGAQLSWDATDKLNVWLSWATDRTDDVSSGVNFGGYLITPYQPTLKTQDGFLFSEQYQWNRENPAVRDRYKVDQNDELRTRNYNNNKYIAHVSWDLDNVTVKYIGGYFEGDYSAKNGDLGGTSNPDVRVVESAAQNSESYSHELQLISASDGPLQWVTGLYYYHQNVEQPYAISSLEGDYLQNTVPENDLFNPAAIQPNRNPAAPEQYWQNGDLDVDSYAAYADGNYSFNEQWKLTLGIRYSYDEKEGDEAQYVVADPYAAPGADVLPPIWGILGFPANCCGLLITDPREASRKLDDDWNNVSGRAVIDYRYSDEQMVYASISSGYKAGGFRLGSLQENPSFDPEEVISYEIGYKGTYADVLRVNAAAYFYDYSDMQVLVDSLNDVNLPVPEIVNADEAEVKGFEVEATWLATDALTLMANYSYTDGEYTKFCCAVDTIGDPDGGEQDLSGNPLTQAPKNKIFTNASYSWNLDSMGELVLSGSYSWVDSRQYDVFNTAATQADSYYRVDASVTWFSPSQDIRVIMAGKNLTEEETWVSLNRLNEFGAISGYANEPMTYSLEVQYTF
ncbi:MAG: TonB-dependent receptor [Halieaceae bacterium]|jgi:iron complex outermembrane receptor protein|nr:TonB-dependent receptor [Halieaceae bacterium]